MSQHRVNQVITRIDRQKNSRDGNPRFTLSFENGESWTTAANTDYAFDIGNPGYRVGDVVDIDINGRGTIDRIRKGEPQAWVVLMTDFEEKAARATGVVAVFTGENAKERADEHVCYCYISEAEDRFKGETEEADGEDIGVTFYDLLTEGVADLDFYFHIDRNTLYGNEVDRLLAGKNKQIDAVVKLALRVLACDGVIDNDGDADTAADLYRSLYGEDYGEQTFSLAAINAEGA